MYVNYSLETGGIEQLIYTFTQHINRQMYEPEVVTFREGGVLPEVLRKKMIPVHNIKKKSGLDFSLVMRLAKLFKDRGVKIIHTNNYDSWFYGALAAKLSRGVRHVHTEHSNISGIKKRTLENVLVRLTDDVVAVSDPVKKGMLQRWNCSDAVSVIYNGVDCNKFKPDYELKNRIRGDYGVGKDVFLIGIVARLVPVKNHKVLLRALQLLCSRSDNIHLLLVGDGELKDALKAETEALGIEKAVSFLGEKDNINEILNALDVFVLCSFSEGLSVTLIEAMSTGLPVVATNVGGNPEIVKDGETGLLVPSNDPPALADAFEKLLLDTKLRAVMSFNARKRALEIFNIDDCIRNYELLYSKHIAHSF